METQNDVLVGVLAAMQNPPGIEDFAGAIPPDEALIDIVSAAYGELADALEDGPLAGSLRARKSPCSGTEMTVTIPRLLPCSTRSKTSMGVWRFC